MAMQKWALDFGSVFKVHSNSASFDRSCNLTITHIHTRSESTAGASRGVAAVILSHCKLCRTVLCRCGRAA